MAKTLNPFILLLFLLLCSDTYTVEAQSNFRVLFYNTENLYDIHDNPATNDDDLLPTGNLHWTSYRYWKKLNEISRVIMAVGGTYPPAIIGLCEVENASVLDDLTKKTALKKHKYDYIITHSQDRRGSNTALLYQRDQLKILSNKSYTPTILVQDSILKTRDILHVVAKVVSGDTLDIFVCHFPSRTGGIKRSSAYRIACAKLLKNKTDSLFGLRKKANILIMGDFNDYPNDVSLDKTLEARSTKSFVSHKKLYNLFYHLAADTEVGSYKYHGKWNFIDHFIVSGNLLNSTNSIKIKGNTAATFVDESLMEKDVKYGGTKPKRTYSGYKYLGGASDHLPIYMDFILKER